jgi:hypothetical protein
VEGGIVVGFFLLVGEVGVDLPADGAVVGDFEPVDCAVFMEDVFALQLVYGLAFINNL